MKTCPQCGTVYPDETLRFCLADGTALIASGEEPTLVSGRRGVTNVNITPPTTPAIRSPVPPKKGSSRTLFKVIIALVVVGILGIALIGGAGLIYLISLSSESNQSEPERPTEPNRPSRSATPDPDKAKLEKELADLKEKLKDQQSTPDNTNPFPDDGEISVFKTATVNSPGDGFLALRNLPSSDAGDRIAKIPNGEKVEILACNPTEETIGGRSGKWCLVTWNETAGWVFDAWLEY